MIFLGKTLLPRLCCEWSTCVCSLVLSGILPFPVCSALCAQHANVRFPCGCSRNLLLSILRRLMPWSYSPWTPDRAFPVDRQSTRCSRNLNFASPDATVVAMSGHVSRCSGSACLLSEDEFGILVDDRCIDTGAFQPRYLVHELVFACRPPPAAAPQGQPHYPDSSRLVLHSMRVLSSSHPDRGDRFSSVLALLEIIHGAQKQKCAHDKSQSSQHLFPAHSSRLPQARNPNAVNQRTTVMPWKRKRSWTVDAFCRLGSSLTPQYDSELGLGPPEALIPRDEESSEENRPFLPRFLLQAIVFAHSPYGGLFPNRPSLQGNLLCRSDWLRLRGISETECVILPIRDLVAFPHCSVCEARSSGALLGAAAPVGASASRRFPQAAGSSALVREFRQGRQPMLGAQTVFYDSEPDLWKWDLDTAGDHCFRVPRPVLQSAVQFRPRLLLQELILAHSLSDCRRSIHGSPIAKSDWLSLREVAHTECATIMFQATVNY